MIKVRIIGHKRIYIETKIREINLILGFFFCVDFEL